MLLKPDICDNYLSAYPILIISNDIVNSYGLLIAVMFTRLNCTCFRGKAIFIFKTIVYADSSLEV